MTLQEMQLTVAEKLPELIETHCGWPNWIACVETKGLSWEIHWATEGLQVCHEAEKLIKAENKWKEYGLQLQSICDKHNGGVMAFAGFDATYEQRLEALSRVWFPERFKNL